MYLIDYIHQFADTRCSGDLRRADTMLGRKFGVTPRAVQSWRLGQRVPQVEFAREIVRKTKGAVDYEGIYAPYKKIRKR